MEPSRPHVVGEDVRQRGEAHADVVRPVGADDGVILGYDGADWTVSYAPLPADLNRHEFETHHTPDSLLKTGPRDLLQLLHLIFS